MKNRHARISIGTRARVVTRQNFLAAFLPIVLFAALMAALVFLG